MITETEIKQLAQYLKEDLNGKRIRQQREGLSYYEDTFPIPENMKPYQVRRTGMGARIIDGAAENIITSNPQVFRDPRNKGDTDANARVMALLNNWAKLMLIMSPHPYKEAVKNALLMGEAWTHIVVNKNWEPDALNKLPFIVGTLDPMTVFHDYTQEDFGVPEQVIISCDKSVSWVRKQYPNWMPRDPNARNVKWLEYWDDEAWYIAIDDLSIGGIKKNAFGFVPFVHCFSGYGRVSSSEGAESLAIGRLTRIKDVLLEQAMGRSDTASIIHRYAFPHKDLFVPPGQPEPTGDVGADYNITPGAFNVIVGADRNWMDKDTAMVPPPEMFNHLYMTESFLTQDFPPILRGMRTGSSGRQEDIVGGFAVRRYDTVVENIEHLFSVTLGQALRICDTIPDMKPKALNKNDINGNYLCEVKLKADDLIERDRMVTLGARLHDSRKITHKRFLVEHYGLTEEEADKEIEDIMVDEVTINDPFIREMIGRRVAQKLGWEDEYEAMKAKRVELEKRQAGLQPTAEPRTGNIKAPLGEEMIDMSLTERGARRPPEGYFRG